MIYSLMLEGAKSRISGALRRRPSFQTERLVERSTFDKHLDWGRKGGKIEVEAYVPRKGNPISVRLDLNRSSDSSWFSHFYYVKLVQQDITLGSYFFLSDCKRGFTRFFDSLGFGTELTKTIQWISELVIMCLLKWALGVLVMNELSEAVRPYLNTCPEMPGGSSTSPGPLGHEGPATIYTLNEEKEYAPNEENHRQELVAEPLMEDSVRREELKRFSDALIRDGGECESPKAAAQRFEFQVALDKRLESALREDGFTETSIMETRWKWRRAALTLPAQDKLVKAYTLKQYLKTKDIRKSSVYLKIMKASSYLNPHGEIHLKKWSN